MAEMDAASAQLLPQFKARLESLHPSLGKGFFLGVAFGAVVTLLALLSFSNLVSARGGNPIPLLGAWSSDSSIAVRGGSFRELGVPNDDLWTEAREAYSVHLQARKGSSTWPLDTTVPEEAKSMIEAINGNLNDMGSIFNTLRGYYFSPLYYCPRETRIGHWVDGGKWLCHVPTLKDAVVYSVGSFGESSFEAGILEVLGTVSFTFDPTMPASQLERKPAPYMKFYEVGLHGQENGTKALELLTQSLQGHIRVVEGAKMMRLDEIMSMLQHTYVDVLKIDCEGCEIEVFDGLLRDLTAGKLEKVPIGQVLVELHCATPQGSTDVLHFFRTMEVLGFVLYHFEENFLCDTCVELAYLHKSVVGIP